MKVLKPPTPLEEREGPSLFLAGTIDNGASVDWQAQVSEALSDLPGTILNPRRDSWDPTWEQSIHNKPFKEQVEWELQGLEEADVIMIYFAPGSKSPISLLELGLFAHSRRMLVCAPEGFWRKGNIEVVCERYKIPRFEHLQDLIEEIRIRLSASGDKSSCP